ncbi:malate synthase G [Flocculibacter collagenilyticus]|uniref:malate synthase G n=1 Tax=Flocculibacter collagenilyticus TaxID=2744479 RepID=UPI0018F55365|nr:malate synthase G [Flocculibacter collagenilyticus]
MSRLDNSTSPIQYNSSSYTSVGQLQVANTLYQFMEQEALPGLGISSDDFWQKFADIAMRLTPINHALLEKREKLQQQIDQWHKDHQADFNLAQYKQFLLDINYLLPEGDDFEVTTKQVDAEIATIAGPQLVVPVKNARFALNAANARWGSLYDALYGSNVISEANGAEKIGGYNPIRGQQVVNYAKEFLDKAVPLKEGKYSNVVSFNVEYNKLEVYVEKETGDLTKTTLQDKTAFVGYKGEKNAPSAILLKNNGLHIEIQLDKSHPIGKDDAANIKDVLLESAITTIQDCEDSVAAVDAEDKTQVYRNWLGLMNGNLSESFDKQGKTITRSLNTDRTYLAPDDTELVLSGRSLMLVRNVGHLMTNSAVLFNNEQGELQEIPEGILDAMVTSTIALHDITGKSKLQNSAQNSVYIVKPKMHGPEEVAFACDLFTEVEQALNIPKNTLKIGIMDEERRTTLNLKACIRAAQSRVIFINTGFLDRTGDEIHTSMHAGVFVPKAQMKNQAWIKAYEQWNVETGLMCGLQGKAQIGKGMWPKPDELAEMMETKVAHPKAGANCAWVPSPTAATLHVTHYHEINVAEQQQQIKAELANEQREQRLDDLLTIPLQANAKETLDEQEIQKEIDNNAQGILGYVVRWIDQGVGCSKVPDIDNVGLMEDRATLRISSQYLANWLLHGVCSEAQVMASMKRMAEVVDQQNSGDSSYQPMSADFENSIAFQAACDLVFKGEVQPSGYTEPLLHQRRLQKKAQA